MAWGREINTQVSVHVGDILLVENETDLGTLTGGVTTGSDQTPYEGLVLQVYRERPAGV